MASYLKNYGSIGNDRNNCQISFSFLLWQFSAFIFVYRPKLFKNWIANNSTLIMGKVLQILRNKAAKIILDHHHGAIPKFLWTDFCVRCKLIKLLILGLDGLFEVMYITPQYLIEILLQHTTVLFWGEKPRTEKNLFKFFATNTYNFLINGTSCVVRV